MLSEPVYQTAIDGLELLARGKVRDIYAVDDDHLAIVATDRLSAFDVIMPDPVPGKGAVLTEISRFWFRYFADTIANHTTRLKLIDVAGDTAANRALESRTMVVKRLTPLPMEAVARGYLIGSGWKDYQRTGTVCGHRLGNGIELAGKLPEPLFTPATKAADGDHDENISFEQLSGTIGTDRAREVRDITLALYARGAAYARERGIIIADTKFEFGLDDKGRLHLIDEVLTPDSSRFWPVADYRPGVSPASFDKQFVRDYLETLDWNKQSPGPSLPAQILTGTADRYQQALQLLTGD